MKWIFTALLLAGLIACNDDDPAPAIITDGEVSVMLEGEDFFSQYKSGIRVGTGALMPCNIKAVYELVLVR